ncbi:gamma-glutamyl-gamma-aminobutyrate hydrolase family protein [Pontibacter roseus]|uniref:gamma-glutamyl-gamma-aminobutyrate hydrolase family protein n=1 Tax=Pontibacter roseus TaxID=336989 RepID=UPI000380721E|nr:gamma-glutamyl-gamma-aminobutyrate hydrolase family protein [Pontibacter roseus]
MGFLSHKNRINRDRPTIGITGPDRGGGAAWFFTALSVWLAGGRPVRITPARPRTADGLQGLIIGGGADVDPSTYEQEHVLDEYLQKTLQQPGKSSLKRIGRFVRWVYYPTVFLVRKLLSRKLTFGLDRERDHLEFQLIDQAVRKDLPVMGICRGAQLMNVYFRGTLYKRLHDFYTEAPNPASIFPVKTVRIQPGSRLEQVLGTQELEVNALHNQAVKEPGQGMAIVAREPNQVVQGIEHTAQSFMIGVQWHPEYLIQLKEHRRLFQALVQQARQVQQQIEEADMQEALAHPKAEVLQELEAGAEP